MYENWLQFVMRFRESYCTSHILITLLQGKSFWVYFVYLILQLNLVPLQFLSNKLAAPFTHLMRHTVELSMCAGKIFFVLLQAKLSVKTEKNYTHSVCGCFYKSVRRKHAIPLLINSLNSCLCLEIHFPLPLEKA